MRIAIIIVNYCTPDFVCNCLTSLMSQVSPEKDCVIVVDNDSKDGSVDLIEKMIRINRFGHWVRLLPLSWNGGFAVGNNAAIRYLLAHESPPDYIMLLNPDTIVHGGAVEILAHFLDEHPEVGVVGAQLENENRKIEPSARRYPSMWSELDSGTHLGMLSRILNKWQVTLPVSNRAHRCDWVSGATMLIRRQVFEGVGLMDEGFFLYFEELDFCQRASGAGWQTWLEPAARVTHLEGRATGINLARRRRGEYWYNSRRRYFIKHHGILRWILADLFWSLGRLSLLVRTHLNLGGDITGDPLYYTRDLICGDLCALINGDAWRIKKTVRKICQ